MLKEEAAKKGVTDIKNKQKAVRKIEMVRRARTKSRLVDRTKMRRLAQPSRNVLWISVPFFAACALPSFVLLHIYLFPHLSSLAGPGSAESLFSLKNMHLWRKMRRVWLSVSARLKSHKPTGGKVGASGNASGLLKLQDDVKMCGYKDVQVMWNLLNTRQVKQMGAAAAATTVCEPRKCSKQRPSWLSFFWSNQRATASSSSFFRVKSSKTVY